MEIITTYGTVFLTMAVIFGLYMTWGIGANDVANAMGTSVGSGAITVKQAILIAAIFEFAGAFIAGGSVTKTIRKGIIDPSAITGSPELLVYGMLAALLAAAGAAGSLMQRIGFRDIALTRDKVRELTAGNWTSRTVDSLAAGSSMDFLVAVIAGDVPSGTVLTNTVEVDSDTFDPDTDNNEYVEETTVQQDFGPSADLGIAKQATPTTVNAGELVTYTITVGNAGPSDVTGATVTDTFQASLTNVTWTCAAGEIGRASGRERV